MCSAVSSRASKSRRNSLTVNAISPAGVGTESRSIAEATARKACASMARVVQRCQERQRPTWCWSSPTRRRAPWARPDRRSLVPAHVLDRRPGALRLTPESLMTSRSDTPSLGSSRYGRGAAVLALHPDRRGAFFHFAGLVDHQDRTRAAERIDDVLAQTIADTRRRPELARESRWCSPSGVVAPRCSAMVQQFLRSKPETIPDSPRTWRSGS